MSPPETIDQTAAHDGEFDPSGPPEPGLVLIFSATRPQFAVIPLGGETVELGRGELGRVTLEDPRMSRRHAQVSFDGRRWTVRDLASRNGTAVDGAELHGELQREEAGVLRLGATLFLLRQDIRPYRAAGVAASDDLVMGPGLLRAWHAIARAGRGGQTLHIHGESGTGKELAARAFHASGPRAAGPFIAVNCASIPEGVAERLLFGVRKGAFSGATADADGYLQAASGGTLFLDEVGELDAAVQAKLLRVLESREVLALGAVHARPVDLRLCSATHKDLREQVAARLLREDLYFRIGRPLVALPPLRERPEEIPWLIEREARLTASGLTLHVSLVETCLLRPWPGNIRELRSEVRTAAQEAVAAGSKTIEARHLAALAGAAFAAAEPAPGEPAAPRVAAPPPGKEVLEAGLRRENGNVARTARLLGVHRTQLRRWLARYGIDPASFQQEPS